MERGQTFLERNNIVFPVGGRISPAIEVTAFSLSEVQARWRIYAAGTPRVRASIVQAVRSARQSASSQLPMGDQLLTGTTTPAVLDHLFPNGILPSWTLPIPVQSGGVQGSRSKDSSVRPLSLSGCWVFRRWRPWTVRPRSMWIHTESTSRRHQNDFEMPMLDLISRRWPTNSRTGGAPSQIQAAGRAGLCAPISSTRL